MGESAISRLVSATQDANRIAAELRGSGRAAVRVLGHDAPYELIRAFDLLPVRLVADTAMNTPAADEFIGRATLSKRGRSLLEQILAAPAETPLVITHADSELPQIFAFLRELMRNGDIPQRQVHFLDLLHLPRAASRDYNRVRIGQFCDWLDQVSGNAITPARWQTTMSEGQAVLALLQQARTLRDSNAPRIAGEELCAMTAAAHILPAGEWQGLMQDALDEAAVRAPLPGTRVLLAGGAQFDCRQHRALSAAGFHIVGDLTDWGDTLLEGPPLTGDWIASFSLPERRRPLALVSAEQKAAHAAEAASRNGAEQVVFLVSPEDEPSAWDAGTVTRMLRAGGLRAGIWRTWETLPGSRELFAEPPVATASAPKELKRTAEKKARGPRPPRGQRSRKALNSVATFNAYQKEWFGEVRNRVREGSALGVVNANSPQEMIRAIGIPFVVNQWWASIVAAKQQSGRYAVLLEQHGYPSDVEAYSSQGLAAVFDDNAENAPWGGLPRPDVLQTILGTDATPRIYDHWAREIGADLFVFERTVEARLDIHPDWWARLPEHWDEELEPIRLDLLTEELKLAISAIEKCTGMRFDSEYFEEVMTLVNEQEDYYRLTRDVIAHTHPAPVSIVDTMPATMVPQWHRGTVWARDAAKSFYEEVKGLADSGNSVCADERLRLMWVGRGIWSNMGFYQRWQESHGAVFVWSMYLGLAADGYIRYFDRGRDPLRALAARFVTMGDELRMPTWAGAWYVKEARTHGVHGAVALSDADPFVLRALRKAGIPVLSLDLDNYQQDRDSERTDEQIGAFLDRLSQDFQRCPV